MRKIVALRWQKSSYESWAFRHIQASCHGPRGRESVKYEVRIISEEQLLGFSSTAIDHTIVRINLAMGSHIHYFISALVLVHTAVSTAPRVLYPLSRRHWNGPEHQLPSWFHRNGHPNGNYWGENDCDKNRTTPQVDFELQGDEQLVWGSPNGLFNLCSHDACHI